MRDYREFEAAEKALGTTDLEMHARWWDHLAECELDELTWNKLAMRDVAHHRANLYRRTAESIRIEERTGVAVCVCCFKPATHHQLYGRQRQ